MKKYRITSKFRFTMFLTVMVLCIFTIIGSVSGLSNVNSGSMKEYNQIKVEPGDTLWNIAANYQPQDKDIREVVFDICEINGISASELTAGLKILVPVYS